jgi:hypothetical protein
MSKPDWFNSNPAAPEPISDKQKWLLLRSHDQVMDILEPQERVNVEIMDYAEWIGTLTKYEASKLIGILKGASVADEVRRKAAGEPPRKWFQTGLSG